MIGLDLVTVSTSFASSLVTRRILFIIYTFRGTIGIIYWNYWVVGLKVRFFIVRRISLTLSKTNIL